MSGLDQTRAEINILACANDAYMQHLAVMLVSLLTNNPDARVHAVVVAGNSGAAQRDRLARTMARFPSMRLEFRAFKPDPGLRFADAG